MTNADVLDALKNIKDILDNAGWIIDDEGNVELADARELDLKSRRIVNVGNPSLATDAATKQYVDGEVSPSVQLDLQDDDTAESSGLTEIATNNDSNSIFTLPSTDKLLIDVSQNWPVADLANSVPENSIGSVEISPDAVGESQLDLSISPSWTSPHTFQDSVTFNASITVNADATFTQGISAQGVNAQDARITNVGTPSASSDAATKDYVDNQVSGAGGKTFDRFALSVDGTPQTFALDAQVEPPNFSFWGVSAVNSSIYELDSNFNTVKSVPPPSSTPTGIDVNEVTDCLWTTDEQANRAYRLDQSGSVISNFGTADSPKDLDVNEATGCIWLAANDSFFKKTKGGSTVTAFASPCLGADGVAANELNGCLWVTDGNSSSIFKTNQTGSIVTGFITPSAVFGQRDVAGIEIDEGSGCLWVVAGSEFSIFKLDQQGNKQSQSALPNFINEGVDLEDHESVFVRRQAQVSSQPTKNQSSLIEVVGDNVSNNLFTSGSVIVRGFNLGGAQVTGQATSIEINNSGSTASNIVNLFKLQFQSDNL